MLRFFLASALALISPLMFAFPMRAQAAPPQQSKTVTDQKAAPAPRHDISGTWDPGNGGIQPLGPAAKPEDGKPEHQIPYTPLGLETLSTHKPSNGIRSVLPGDTNDPVVYCDPQGMPREDLYELRTTQILQTPLNVYVLYQFGKIWRVVWTDGREVPKDPEPRWFGYSVGKWRMITRLSCGRQGSMKELGSTGQGARTAPIWSWKRSFIAPIKTLWNSPSQSTIR